MKVFDIMIGDKICYVNYEGDIDLLEEKFKDVIDRCKTSDIGIIILRKNKGKTHIWFYDKSRDGYFKERGSYLNFSGKDSLN